MFGFVPPERAAACRIARANLEENTQYAELIVVGEVVSERELHDAYESYESTIEVAAVLKGSAGSEITIAPTGWLGADCSGSPRLRDGERVLLFLYHYRGPAPLGTTPPAGALQIAGYDGGKYVIGDGNVRSTYAEPAQFPAEQAIRRVAQLAGSAPAQLDAALRFGAPHVFDTPEPPASREIDCSGDFFTREELEFCTRPRLEDTSAWAVGPLIVVAVVLLGTIVLAGTMLARRRAQ